MPSLAWTTAFLAAAVLLPHRVAAPAPPLSTVETLTGLADYVDCYSDTNPSTLFDSGSWSPFEAQFSIVGVSADPNARYTNRLCFDKAGALGASGGGYRYLATVPNTKNPAYTYCLGMFDNLNASSAVASGGIAGNSSSDTACPLNHCAGNSSYSCGALPAENPKNASAFSIYEVIPPPVEVTPSSSYQGCWQMAAEVPDAAWIGLATGALMPDGTTTAPFPITNSYCESLAISRGFRFFSTSSSLNFRRPDWGELYADCYGTNDIAQGLVGMTRADKPQASSAWERQPCAMPCGGSIANRTAAGGYYGCGFSIARAGFKRLSVYKINISGPCGRITDGAPPPNSQWPSGGCGTEVGTKCSATCNANFECFQGVCPTFTCEERAGSEGQWSGISGGCVPKSCSGNPTATNPANAVWGCATITSGSGGVCTATCSPGFTAATPPSAVCNAGSWSQVGGGECKPNGCASKPIAAVPGGGSWPDNCNNAASGSTCAAQCSSGLTGSIASTCQLGTWQPVVGAACANCSVSLQAGAASSVCVGDGLLTAAFTFTASNAGTTTFTATADGVPCSTPAPLSGPQLGAPITVTCTAPPAGFAVGSHIIRLTATNTGASGTACLTATQTASATATVRPPAQVAVVLATEPAPVCNSTGAQTATASFAYNVTPSPDSGPLQLTATATAPGGITCTVTFAEPNAAQGSLEARCIGVFTGVSTAVTVALQAAQPQCSQAAEGSAQATFNIKCCTSIGSGLSSSIPASAKFDSDGDALTCRACTSNQGVFFTKPGADGIASGPLVAGLNSICGGGAALAGTSVNVTCGTTTNAVFFNVTAPAFSSLDPSYLIRCSTLNVGTLCTFFTPLQPKRNNPVYAVQETNSAAGGLVLSWQVPLATCSCRDAFVAVRATGTLVGEC